MSLNVNDIRSLFFDAVTGAPRATIDNAALQAFIAACDVNVGHPDANALAAAQAMLPGGGGPLAAPAPVSAGLLTALAAHNFTGANVLVEIAGRTGLAGDLDAIVANANRSVASDSAVLRSAVVAGLNAVSLTAIATRTVLPAELLQITDHANANNPGVITAILGNALFAGLNAVRLGVLATRTAVAAQLDQIADHANANNPAVITAILGNALVGGLSTARLAVLASRTAVAAQLDQIADHANANNPAVITAILGNNALVGGLNAARLTVLANRTVIAAQLD